MKYTVENNKITLEFDDGKEAYELSRAISSYKHFMAPIEPDHDHMKSQLWTKMSMLQMGEALNEVIEALPPFKHSFADKDVVIPYTNVLEFDSSTAKHILARLKILWSPHRNSARARHILSESGRARLYIRAFFAPFILSDEVADAVIQEMKQELGRE